MTPKEILVIAPNAAADRLGAGLIHALRGELANAEAGYTAEAQPLQASLAPRFYGWGGLEMARAGVELLHENEKHISGIAPFSLLHDAALSREPDMIVCIGASADYHRFCYDIKSHVHRREGTFCNWDPILVRLEFPGSSSQNHGGQGADKNFDRVLNEHFANMTDFADFAARQLSQLLHERLEHFRLRGHLA